MENLRSLRSVSGPTNLTLNGDGELLTEKLTGVRSPNGPPMLRSDLIAEEPPTITRSASEPVSHTEESTTSSG